MRGSLATVSPLAPEVGLLPLSAGDLDGHNIRVCANRSASACVIATHEILCPVPSYQRTEPGCWFTYLFPAGSVGSVVVTSRISGVAIACLTGGALSAVATAGT